MNVKRHMNVERHISIQRIAACCLALGCLVLISDNADAQNRQRQRNQQTRQNNQRADGKQFQTGQVRNNRGNSFRRPPWWKKPNNQRPPEQVQPPQQIAPDLKRSVIVDGNTIDITTQSGRPGKVGIRLKVGNNVTWWKGIKIRDYRNRTDLHNGFAVGKEKFLELQDAPNGATAFARFDFADLTSDGNVRIDFWKAKAFGVHTFMIRHTFPLEAMKGKDVTFTWRE